MLLEVGNGLLERCSADIVAFVVEIKVNDGMELGCRALGSVWITFSFHEGNEMLRLTQVHDHHDGDNNGVLYV